ncbi:hypothetical protein EIN_025990 [Entamoeba invadens IP1]|uniref:hypothetical protein n=1 Tax=Entamoeba invadens IP1 TaxID=370355 RepID=UPI0002C3F9D6|nr:hypothetical protein EIN_025990 [Entamoeba invadens IP1]ELP90760.1 hypothetical protein EIN_025990 [Entamoeba invadens IP1]|eukprot:XP_004257531.1 hypothetical protein EIN_025990 [Entamoeba invadens IP1]
MDICIVNKKAVDTEGIIPTALYTVNRGFMYELKKDGKFCYYYVSTKYANSSRCFDEQYIWTGIDDFKTTGVNLLPDEHTLQQMKDQQKIILFEPGQLMSEIVESAINWDLFNEYTPDNTVIKFSQIGREYKLIISEAKQLVAMIGMVVDYGKGKTGSTLFCYINDAIHTVYVKYDLADTSFLSLISETNMYRVSTMDNSMIIGNPQARNDLTKNINQNLYMMHLVDKPEVPQFPVTVTAPYFVPPQKQNLFGVGEAVELSEKYMLYSDPKSDRGVVYASRWFGGDKLDFRATLNPFPRWGNYQNFGKFMSAVKSSATTTELYVAAPTAWVHDDIRKASTEGRGTTEYIGIIYHFQIEDDVGCEAKTYYFVQSDKEKGGIFNSTIHTMLKVNSDIIVTLENYDGVYKVQCDDVFKLHL